MTHNNLQSTAQKTKDQATQTPLKTGGSSSTSGTRRVTLVTNPVALLYSVIFSVTLIFVYLFYVTLIFILDLSHRLNSSVY